MCRNAMVAAGLCWWIAAPIGLAQETSSPGPAPESRTVEPTQRPSASPFSADAGRADELRWLAVPALSKAAVLGDAPTSRWAWCIVGGLTLGLLGLMSFGWREGHLPAVLTAALAQSQPSCPADPPAHPRPRKTDVPGRVGGEIPRPHFLRTGGSLCVGLCGGGEVWEVR